MRNRLNKFNFGSYVIWLGIFILATLPIVIFSINKKTIDDRDKQKFIICRDSIDHLKNENILIKKQKDSLITILKKVEPL